MSDLIDRQSALNEITRFLGYLDEDMINRIHIGLKRLNSIEPLTDKEQRIFLSAMAREREICKEMDTQTIREAYEVSLTYICDEIERKIKGALWT